MRKHLKLPKLHIFNFFSQVWIVLSRNSFVISSCLTIDSTVAFLTDILMYVGSHWLFYTKNWNSVTKPFGIRHLMYWVQVKWKFEGFRSSLVCIIQKHFHFNKFVACKNETLQLNPFFIRVIISIYLLLYLPTYLPMAVQPFCWTFDAF
jgi:hypothetical protein